MVYAKTCSVIHFMFAELRRSSEAKGGGRGGATERRGSRTVSFIILVLRRARERKRGAQNQLERIQRERNESISKIKKKLPQLGLAQLRDLSAEEASGKNRKGLQSEIKKAMNAA